MRSYLKLQEASRDQVLVCPHRKKENYKPERITNETTQARIYEVLKPSPPYCFSTKKPTMLDGEMKNSRMLWKVRDRENGERRMACQKKKKDSLLPVKGEKKKTRVGGRKPLSLKLPSTVSRSSVSSYYQCQSAFMGRYEPDMLSVPSRVFAIRATPIYLKMYCSGKD